MVKKDKKGRILKAGESQRKDGRYCYTYIDTDEKKKCVYSWRLVATDEIPVGKKETISLREQEEEINKILSKGATVRTEITVSDIVNDYLEIKKNVLRESTYKQYESNIKLLAVKSFGKKKINKIKYSDAKKFFIELHKLGYKRGSINGLKAILQPSFQLAVENDILVKNPFNFKLSCILKDDAEERTALTEEQEEKLLSFVKNSSAFSKYYDMLYIMLNTGVRVGELCGLTVNDIDFVNKTVTINKQLSDRRRITPPKSESGNRTIPISELVCISFKNVINSNAKHNKIPIIDGYGNFIFISTKGNVLIPTLISSRFKHIMKAYTEEYPTDLIKLTPHVCRHTYCTKLIKAGVNPKSVEYIMGHSDISITMNTYTHTDLESVKADMLKVGIA